MKDKVPGWMEIHFSNPLCGLVFHQGLKAAPEQRVIFERFAHGLDSRRASIIAGIIVARHMDTADDLFGGPPGSPRTDKMVAAAVQWATHNVEKN